MDEPTDHMKEYERTARRSLSKNHKMIYGLDGLRAAIKADEEEAAKRAQGIVPKRPRKKDEGPRANRQKVTPELRDRILATSGTLNEVAELLGISATTVFRVRRSAQG